MALTNLLVTNLDAVPADPHDYTAYVVSTGYGWQRNDLDDESSGRTLDGIMHRSRIAQKRVLQIKMRRMDNATYKQLLADLKPLTSKWTYVEPAEPTNLTNSTKVGRFYNSQATGTLVFGDSGTNTLYWDEIQFQLTEV